MASLSLKHINKTYPNGFEAVKDFNLEIGIPLYMRSNRCIVTAE